MEVKSYRDLLVWQKAMDLMVECYLLTEKLPKSETYGLIGEIKRSAVHVPSYIADGHGREYTNEFLQRLSAAYGQLMYLETHWLAVDRLQYLPMSEIEPILNRCSEVGKMVNGLIRSLKNKRS
jgi:four helix bundle protein